MFLLVVSNTPDQSEHVFLQGLKRRFPKLVDTMLLTQCSMSSGQNSVKKKSCQSSCLESQIINIKLKKIIRKVPGPPPKLSASGRRTGSNLEHCNEPRESVIKERSRKDLICQTLKLRNLKLRQTLPCLSHEHRIEILRHWSPCLFQVKHGNPSPDHNQMPPFYTLKVRLNPSLHCDNRCLVFHMNIMFHT